MIQLDVKVRGTYVVDPFPRNVHPQHNKGRRAARSKAFLSNTSGIESFVDAAQYGCGDKFTVSAVNRGGLLSVASVRTTMVDLAGQVAIAIAILDPKRSTIYTDSRVAVRAFASGLVAKEAAALLKKKSHTDCPSHYLVPSPHGRRRAAGSPEPE